MESAIQSYLDQLVNHKSLSQNSRQAYAADIRRFAGYLQAQFPQSLTLSDITPSLVEAFLVWEQQQGSKHSTVQRRIAALHGLSEFLRQFGEEDAAGHIDAGLTSVPGDGAVRSPTGVLTREQIAQILQSMEGVKRSQEIRDRAIFELLLHSGISVSTLISLDLKDLDIVQATLHIKVPGMRSRFHLLGQAADAVKAYLAAARPELKPDELEDALFISQKGGRITRQAVWQRLHRIGMRADLPCKLTPRVLRNTAAYRFKQAGYPAREIRRRLGHRSLRSTQVMLERLASCVSC